MTLRQRRKNRMTWDTSAVSRIAGAAFLSALLPFAANAQPQAIMAPGDAIITGFSGVAPAFPPFPSGDPLDETFIDLNGSSMQIQRLQPGGPPAGQLIASPTVFAAPARDVGQVFAITLDDAPTPNIFLGASSVFGLQIVIPDNDGDGRPERVKTGQPGAQFMQGQWGAGGSPGSIYRVDGTTGFTSLFTTIGANAGPGLGDVIYDRSSHQYFASDLDTGLIYRLDWTGLITDTYDHGLVGRPAMGLAPVADDGTFMDITSPAFDSENPATWGYTQEKRRVWGMAMRGGRVYYSVAGSDAGVPQIWSVGVKLDGTFAGNPRWELDVAFLVSTNPVSDILFDNQGQMTLAQRGLQRGSYDYSVFAEPLRSSVVRYRRDLPDNPATPGIWVPLPDDYTIGFRPDGRNTNGGIALGYGWNSAGHFREGTCNEYLWTTGESLRDNPALAPQLAPGGPATVHGLQGNHRNLVRPANDPPFSSYFTDYDGNFIDPQNQGHMGDVEIWQPCRGGYYPPPPPHIPPPPPRETFNLTLEKEADPDICAIGGIGYICEYTVRITNTGTTVFWGAIPIHDWLPANPPGAIITFAPWPCVPIGPSAHECAIFPPWPMLPGDSIDLFVTVDLPARTDLCYLTNAARIAWPPGLGDANPDDDFDFATAEVPNRLCPPPRGETTNLKIEKTATSPICQDGGTDWHCQFDVWVTNEPGGGVYVDDIVITDTLSVPNDMEVGGIWPWNCTNPGPVHTCTYPAAELPGGQLNPGEGIPLWVDVTIPKAQMARADECAVINHARITHAPGGSPLNTNPADDVSAAVPAETPGEHCPPLRGRTDLEIVKEGIYCSTDPRQNWLCWFRVMVTNNSAEDFAGPVTVKDNFFPFIPPSVTYNPDICVDDGAGGFDCTRNMFIAGGATIWMFDVGGYDIPDDGDLCEVRNEVRITAPAGGDPRNFNPGNDHADATLLLPMDRCDEPPPTAQAPSPPPACPLERRIPPPEGGCCPEGQPWNGRTCGSTPPPPPPPEVCPPGTHGIPPYCETNLCPPGTVGTPPNCRQPPQACPSGTHGTPPNCIPNKCPPGTVGTPPECRQPPAAQCPKGMIGTPPYCRQPPAARCPTGMIGTPPNCRQPPAAKCPAGTIGTPPNCRRPPVAKCPPGTVGIPPLCIPTQTQQCPDGMVLTRGKCLWPQSEIPTTPQTPPSTPPQTGPTKPLNPGILQIFPNLVPQLK
jgi:hypothetical protein